MVCVLLCKYIYIYGWWIRVRIWGKGSHPASCKEGFWNPFWNGSVFGNFGPYKKHRFLAPTFDSKIRHHFVRWQLSSWYECCILLDDLFPRSCDFRERFWVSFCKATTSGSLLLFLPVSLIFKQPFCKDSFSLPPSVFLYVCFFGIIACQNSWWLSRIKNMYKSEQ